MHSVMKQKKIYIYPSQPISNEYFVFGVLFSWKLPRSVSETMQTCFSTVKTETSISVWRARAKSLSAVHFSSLLGSLKRLWQFSKWSFSQMPACGLQHRYDVYVQFMQMSPFPPCGRVSMRCLLFLWYQAATQHISLSVVSVLIEVHHCRAASERLRLNIFSLPFLISECVLICLCIVSLCYCTSS